MNWLNRTSILISREFTEFYSSKAWIVVLILPLFITFIFATIYHPLNDAQYEIAYTADLPPAMLQIIKKSHLKLVKYTEINSAKTALNSNHVDAVLIPQPRNNNRFTLLVNQSGYTKAVAISNALNVVLIRLYANPNIPQLVISGSVKRSPQNWMALPLWLIQIILTICLLQNTAIIADEKDRQTLHSLLVSPMTLAEYLAAKLSWSTFLGVAALLLTLVLTQSPARPFTILIFGTLGALVYSSLSLLIGLLSPNALFARTASTVLYLCSSLPLMVNNVDLAWKNVLNLIPTFLILRGFETSLVSTITPPTWQFALWLLGEFLFLLLITRFSLRRKADF